MTPGNSIPALLWPDNLDTKSLYRPVYGQQCESPSPRLREQQSVKRIAVGLA